MIAPGRSGTHSRHVSKPGSTPGMGSLQGGQTCFSKARPLKPVLVGGWDLLLGKGRWYCEDKEALGAAGFEMVSVPACGVWQRAASVKVAEYLPLAFRAGKLCHLPGSAPLPPRGPPGCCPWS